MEAEPGTVSRKDVKLAISEEESLLQLTLRGWTRETSPQSDLTQDRAHLRWIANCQLRDDFTVQFWTCGVDNTNWPSYWVHANCIP